ncbi:hypothetical protein CDCA_CDCA04G1405 [Cyanidium caldarium]|uniref:Uncharacterized protein n=1 Tax=Cyanidium caldarium TaxID=2771 RepID=A0AAV9ITE8_CYACA|nr:hypothetical protein CDCA_CDCA04G1405 [Cyanidium caldarium]
MEVVGSAANLSTERRGTPGDDVLSSSASPRPYPQTGQVKQEAGTWPTTPSSSPRRSPGRRATLVWRSRQQVLQWLRNSRYWRDTELPWKRAAESAPTSGQGDGPWTVDAFSSLVRPPPDIQDILSRPAKALLCAPPADASDDRDEVMSLSPEGLPPPADTVATGVAVESSTPAAAAAAASPGAKMEVPRKTESSTTPSPAARQRPPRLSTPARLRRRLSFAQRRKLERECQRALHRLERRRLHLEKAAARETRAAAEILAAASPLSPSQPSQLASKRPGTLRTSTTTAAGPSSRRRRERGKRVEPHRAAQRRLTFEATASASDDASVADSDATITDSDRDALDAARSPTRTPTRRRRQRGRLPNAASKRSASGIDHANRPTVTSSRQPWSAATAATTAAGRSTYSRDPSSHRAAMLLHAASICDQHERQTRDAVCQSASPPPPADRARWPQDPPTVSPGSGGSSASLRRAERWSPSAEVISPRSLQAARTSPASWSAARGGIAALPYAAFPHPLRMAGYNAGPAVRAPVYASSTAPASTRSAPQGATQTSTAAAAAAPIMPPARENGLGRGAVGNRAHRGRGAADP